MPDGGSARADFPGDDAATLHRSMKRVPERPVETALLWCHDDGPGRRDIGCETTVGDERAHHNHVTNGVTEAALV